MQFTQPKRPSTPKHLRNRQTRRMFASWKGNDATTKKTDNMKKLILLLAVVLGLSATTMADNIEGVAKAKVELSYNGFNFLQVAYANSENASVRVKLYSSNFDLLHSSSLKDSKIFNITQLEAGNYIVKVEKDGVDIYTEVIRKVK
ncbi:MAG: hypothetical protein RIS47_243 [Bacteroidota bacterium]|jgi:hypothetical protein